MPIIAIDGPAGSGKSTVARAVALRLGLDYLDTGAMYRSVAYAALRRDIDPYDRPAIAALAGAVEIGWDGDRVLVDGTDATTAIRGPVVSGAVSPVAAVPEVRADLQRRQRAWALERGGGVLEGRDIGTVVFPDADLKVYLTASPHERARRRAEEFPGQTLEAIAANIASRDALDSERDTDPLQTADDAVVLDTTGLTVDEVVDAIVGMLDDRS